MTADVAHAADAVGPVVLLDRDGTIVIDRDYLADPAGLEFLPGAAAGLRRLHQGGWRLVVISNQSGVGRGLLTLERLGEINARLTDMVRAIGAQLAGIYCCPHRPEDDCACRKPRTQLVETAARELGFDPRSAVVIGDKASDVELGRRIGAKTILVAPAAAAPATVSAAAAPVSAQTGPRPDYIAADLLQAAGVIEAMSSAQ